MTEVESDGPTLPDVLGRIGLHDHLCSIYESPEERLNAPVRSIQMGLGRGEKCIYVADENTVGEVIDTLRAVGTDIDAAVKSGILTIANKSGTYLRQGRFEPDEMIRFWTDAVNAATGAGFTGLRVIGDVTWALGVHPGALRLIEYEAKLNHFVHDYPVVVTCQYDRRRFAPEVILNVIRTHPILAYGRLVCNNPYYVPPQEFLATDHAEMEVERLLANILDRENANKELRELSGRVLRIQDAEHRRIARELHDSIAQELAAVSMNLDELQKRIEGRDRAADNLLADSIALVEQCNREIRTVSHLLHPPLLDELGFERALDNYVKQFAARSGIATTLDIAPDLGRLPGAIETALFRVVQESLGNIHRHSGSPIAAIRIGRDAATVTLEIRDEGRGFPREEREGIQAIFARAGVGITGMRERLEQLGGELKIDTSERGTTVRAAVPLATRRTVKRLS
jgi:signal transduction histidine kinase